MNALEKVAASEVTREGSVQGLLAAFLSGRNERTLRAYARDLEDFRAFLEAATIEDAARALLSGGPGGANAQVLSYRAHLVERGLTPATVNRRLAAIRSLVRVARLLGLTGRPGDLGARASCASWRSCPGARTPRRGGIGLCCASGMIWRSGGGKWRPST
jgi:hypothetical protein